LVTPYGLSLILRRGHAAEHLGRRRLVDPRIRRHLPRGLEDADHADPVHVGGEHRLPERGAHEGLGREVVDLLRVRLLEGRQDRGLVRHVAVEQMETVHERRDVLRVRRAQPADEAEDLVPLGEEQLREV
jgi:hypothetical protein